MPKINLASLIKVNLDLLMSVYDKEEFLIL